MVIRHSPKVWIPLALTAYSRLAPLGALATGTFAYYVNTLAEVPTKDVDLLLPRLRELVREVHEILLDESFAEEVARATGEVVLTVKSVHVETRKELRLCFEVLFKGVPPIGVEVFESHFGVVPERYNVHVERLIKGVPVRSVDLYAYLMTKLMQDYGLDAHEARCVADALARVDVEKLARLLAQLCDLRTVARNVDLLLAMRPDPAAVRLRDALAREIGLQRLP